MLKTIAVLLVAGLLTECNAAAVKPLHDFTSPVPDVSVQAPGGMILNMASGLLKPTDDIKAVTGMVPVPSTDDAVKNATQVIKFIGAGVTYLGDLVQGPVRKAGNVLFSMDNTQFDFTLTASLGADGNCEMKATAAPRVVNMVLDLTSMGPNPISESADLTSKVTSTVQAAVVGALPEPFGNVVSMFFGRLPNPKDICMNMFNDVTPDLFERC